MVSNDFTIRMLGILMPQIPENKSDINDIELNNILRKIGMLFKTKSHYFYNSRLSMFSLFILF